MPVAIFLPIFAILCCVIIAHGALQCFAPAMLKRLEDKLFFPRHINWSESAGGAFLEKLREKQARNPSLLYRLSGFVMMGAGALMLVFGLLRFVH